MPPKKNHKLSLDKFINYALYDKKEGYYMKKNPFGNSGDFTTAPNISRLFSEMIAIWTVSYWHNLGSPKKFNVIVLFPTIAFVVDEEHEPPYVIVPAILDAKV